MTDSPQEKARKELLALRAEARRRGIPEEQWNTSKAKSHSPKPAKESESETRSNTSKKASAPQHNAEAAGATFNTGIIIGVLQAASRNAGTFVNSISTTWQKYNTELETVKDYREELHSMIANGDDIELRNAAWHAYNQYLRILNLHVVLMDTIQYDLKVQAQKIMDNIDQLHELIEGKIVEELHGD